MNEVKEDLEQGTKSKIIPPESGAPFNAVEEVIYRRRSVRYYQDKQVPDYLIRRILETGRFAPSSGNTQPWKFMVIQNQELIKEMSRDVVKMMRLLMKFADYIEKGTWWKEWISKLFQRFSNNMFHPVPAAAMKLIAEEKLGVWHGAPTVIFLLMDRRSAGDPMVDVGISGQNMVLTAHSFGLGTCWVSFCKPIGMMPKWKKRLGIKFPYKLVTTVALGYPRGVPDGQVPRETQAIDWYEEDGSFKVIY
ncbi:MAG: nitroreductase [Proteobacteria bacterium]|nr:nitroreductase [Pseudomonadota bacterium]